jgi:MazG family protein
MTAELPNLRRLLDVIARLRAPDGCPWDRQQSAISMAPYLIEEAHEAVEALQRGDDAGACEELGDVLMNVLMIAQIRSESGGYDAEQIAAGIADKLVRRHPHVFGSAAASDRATPHADWENQKRGEAVAAAKSRGVLAGVPVSMPALLRATRVGDKAAGVGFDWPDRSGPRAKVDEELAELDAAVASGDAAAITDELGDVLFSLCNLARHVGANPELALRSTVAKFQRRFEAVEAELGPDLKGRSLAELDAAWTRAKTAERPSA